MNHYAFAIDLVRKAGARLKEAHSQVITVSHKGGDPRDPVTAVDLEVSALMAAEIARVFPGYRVYSEEGESDAVRSTGYEWVLDPIDGTGNFSHHIPHFAACAALLLDGVPIAGAAYNPITDELFSFDASVGAAFLNGASVTVSAVADPVDGQVIFLGGHREPMWRWSVAVYEELLRAFNKRKGLGSANLDLCFLAAGRADAVVYGTFSMPDGAVGVGAVRAAGGEVYDLRTGAPLIATEGRCAIAAVSTNALFEKIRPLLHAELLPANC